jgi:PAS domain S-box-containing protein
MNAILVPALYGLSGVCAYAMLTHVLIAWRRPVDRMHLLFAAVCLWVALYVIAEAGAYWAETAQALVAFRRWQILFGTLVLGTYVWFVARYTDTSGVWVPAALSAWIVLLGAWVNFALPYGISYNSLPALNHLSLPWGEQVVDLRVHQHSAWHAVMWLAIVGAFVWSIDACVQQYRRGIRRRALTLGLATVFFLVFAAFNEIVNFGLVRFVHLAEFGFLGAVVVMSLGLTHELRERERRLQAILDNVPAVVFMKDLEGRYLMVNRHFEGVYRQPGSTIVGRTARDLLPAAQAETLLATDRKVLETHRSLEFEDVFEVDGEARTYVSLKFPLLDADDRPYAICSVSTDVTELRKAEREARSLQQRIWHTDRVARAGALSASIAHELNQPLAAVLSNAQAALRFLDSGKADPREIREILEDIVRDDKRAAAVISSLRAMVGRQKAARLQVDLSDAVKELLGILRGEMLERQVEVATALAEGCVVMADKGQIQQVVLNLVTNALDAMDGQPRSERRLRISVAREGGNARITVRDSGAGVPAEDIDKVFDAFRSTKPQGMGIGLSVCRSIVESHAGSIRMEQNADRGVSVHVTLPLDEARAATTAV